MLSICSWLDSSSFRRGSATVALNRFGPTGSFATFSPTHGKGVEKAAVIEFHTGLGPWAYGQTIHHA